MAGGENSRGGNSKQRCYAAGVQEDHIRAHRPAPAVRILSFQKQQDFEGIFIRECLDLIYISSYPHSLHPTFWTPYPSMQRDLGSMVSCLSLHYFCKGFSSREVSQASTAPFPARGGQSPRSRQGHPPPIMGLIFLRPMYQRLVPPEYAGSTPHAEPTLLQALLPSGALPGLVPDTAAPENLQGPTPHIPLAGPCPVHPDSGFSCSSPYELRTLRTAAAELACAQGCPEGEHLHLVLPQTTTLRFVPAGTCHPRPSPSPAPCPALLRTAM